MYEDYQNVTEKKLEFGLWYVTHLKQLKNTLAVVTVIALIGIWSYPVYTGVYYLVRGMNEDRAMMANLTQSGFINHEYILSTAPKELIVGGAQTFSSSISNSYDFLTEIRNYNTNRWAEFDYTFFDGNQPIGSGKGYVMPDETKNIYLLFKEMTYRPNNAYVTVNNIVWHKVNKHEIPDWNKYKNERLNVVVNDTSIVPVTSAALGVGEVLNILEFSAINGTAYNYAGVDFNIMFYRGDNIVGVNKYTMSNFMSGEKKYVKINWPAINGSVDKISIVPEMDIMDDRNYIRQVASNSFSQ